MEIIDITVLIAVLVPSILSSGVLIGNLIINGKRELRKNDDMAWETAKELLLKSEHKIYSDKLGAKETANNFDYLYKYLRAVKIDALCKFLEANEEIQSKDAD